MSKKIELTDLPRFWIKDGELYNGKYYSPTDLGITMEYPLSLSWDQAVLREMSVGASLDEIKGLIDIANTTHTRLMKEEKKYSETIKRGLRLSKRWWQKQGREALRNKDFSYVGWYMNMKNRFGWRDKQDVTSDGKQLVGPIPLVPNRDEEILDTSSKTTRSSKKA